MQLSEIVVTAGLDAIPDVMGFVERHAIALDNPKAAQQILLAVEEIAVNVAKYAYDGAPGPLRVAFAHDPERRVVSVCFEDEGKPFDPLAQDAPDIGAPLAERKIGGLGILFVKQLTDTQRYKRAQGKNQFTITKRY